MLLSAGLAKRFSVGTAIILGSTGLPANCMVRDEQLEKELHPRAELAQVTRVTTLGEGTASVAHEVSQPLRAIVSNAHACVELLAAGRAEIDEAREALGDVVAAAERAADVDSADPPNRSFLRDLSSPDRVPLVLHPRSRNPSRQGHRQEG